MGSVYLGPQLTIESKTMKASLLPLILTPTLQHTMKGLSPASHSRYQIPSQYQNSPQLGTVVQLELGVSMLV